MSTNEQRRTTRNGSVVSVISATIVVATLLLAGCGTGSSDSNSNASGDTVDATSGASIVDADGGEITGGILTLGSEASPIKPELVAKDTSGSGPARLAKSTFDPCVMLDRSIQPQMDIRNGVKTMYFRVKIEGRDGLSTLACSTTNQTIPTDTGVGPTDGVSVPCPARYPHADETTGGVAFWWGNYGTPIWGNMLATVSEVSGDNGPGTDGLWNYKFKNSDTNNVLTPRIWLVCT